MQIHLFECKSTVPLRRGLGSNKLNLCMLVLQQLRDTYWSASVTYRLFARAQVLLEKSNSSVSKQAEKLASIPHRTTAASNRQNVDTGHQHQQQHQHHQDQQQNQQYNTDDAMRLMPETDFAMNEQTAPFWLNDSPSFSNVDQLLSPGFSIPENTFQSFFTGYDNGMVGVYDQPMPVSGEIPIDLLYHA